MHRIGLCLLLLFFTIQSLGQDYIKYQRTFNCIDDDLLSQNYPLAISRLDSIYSNYAFIYAKHCIKALQICIVANDSINADKWLAKCFRQGIPVWFIRSNDITKKALTFSAAQNTLHKYDSLHSVYKASIDTTISSVLDSLLIIDQKFTQNINNGFVLLKPMYWLQWGINNQRQFNTLKKIIETNGYPEEKTIGLSLLEDSVKFAKHLSDYGPNELRDSRMQIMIQHCYSTWHKVDNNFKNTLLKNLANGNMPSYQYALLISFMFPDKSKYNNEKFFANNSYYDSATIETINKNRYSIGLNTIEQDKRNTLIQRERRKNKKANSEIMLE